MLYFLFTFLAAVLNFYSIVCMVEIFMSWAPGLKFTSFGRFMTGVTDPYLRIFSRMRFLTIGCVDFSPIIGIGILSLLSSILSRIANTGRIYFGGILASIVYMIWNLFSTIVGIFALFIFIRWIVLLVNHGQTPYNSAWNQIDQFLQKISYKISKIISRKPVKYQTSLLISWITGAVLFACGTILIDRLLILCSRIPF